jgi:hypothetical protein
VRRTTNRFFVKRSRPRSCAGSAGHAGALFGVCGHGLLDVPIEPFRHGSPLAASAEAVKGGRCEGPASCSPLLRPSLDGFEHAATLVPAGTSRPSRALADHDGRLAVVGMTIGGEPACGATNVRATSLYSVGHRPIPMMQLCASAAKLRGGGPILRNGIGSHRYSRDPATSNRQSATRRKRANGAEAVMCAKSETPFSVRDAGRRPRGSRHRGPSATRRSGSCGPKRRSSSCAHHGHSRSGLQTIEIGRCPFGT